MLNELREIGRRTRERVTGRRETKVKSGEAFTLNQGEEVIIGRDPYSSEHHVPEGKQRAVVLDAEARATRGALSRAIVKLALGSNNELQITPLTGNNKLLAYGGPDQKYGLVLSQTYSSTYQDQLAKFGSVINFDVLNDGFEIARLRQTQYGGGSNGGEHTKYRTFTFEMLAD